MHQITDDTIIKYKCKCGYERVIIKDFKTEKKDIKCPECSKKITPV